MPPDSYGKGLLLEAAPNGYVPFNEVYDWPTFTIRPYWSGAPGSANVLGVYNGAANTALQCVSLRISQTNSADAQLQSWYGYLARVTALGTAGTSITPATMDTADSVPSGITAQMMMGSPTGIVGLLGFSGVFVGTNVDTVGLGHLLLNGTELIKVGSGTKPPTFRYGESAYIYLNQGTPSGTTQTVIDSIWRIVPNR
jgi:hypothetical protein